VGDFTLLSEKKRLFRKGNALFLFDEMRVSKSVVLKNKIQQAFFERLIT